MNAFKYQVATLAENGDMDAEMTHRIQSGWKTGRGYRGFCVLKNQLEVQMVLRPAMMYDAETWAVKKAQEKMLDVAEMRMLRLMCAVTKLDRIRDERIRRTARVGEISKKVHKSRLSGMGMY